MGYVKIFVPPFLMRKYSMFSVYSFTKDDIVQVKNGGSFISDVLIGGEVLKLTNCN